MNNTWLLQGNLVNQDQMERVRQAVEACGDRWSTVIVTPFTGETEFFDGEPPDDVIPYGSTALMKQAIARKWSGLYFNDGFTVRQWVSNRTDMVNQAPSFMTILEASEASLTAGLSYFVRPNEDLKAFSGAVLQGDELKLWMGRLVAEPSFDNDTTVCISLAREILAEWRWFVVGGEVVDGSMYRHAGVRSSSHETDAAVVREAQRFADIWLPHPNCVMDTALIATERGARLQVLEFNCLNSSGFYSHDIAKIVRAVSAATARFPPPEQPHRKDAT